MATITVEIDPAKDVFAVHGVISRRTLATVAGSGWRGAQRSDIKEEAEGRGTVAEPSAPPA